MAILMVFFLSYGAAWTDWFVEADVSGKHALSMYRADVIT
jgi:hypothetical protein